MTTNGVLLDSPALEGLEQSLGGLAFDLGRWRKLTELALAEGEKRRERVRQGISEAVAEAEGALRRLDADLDVLRRALALVPIDFQPVAQPQSSPAENPPAPEPAPGPVAPWVQALVDREEGKDAPVSALGPPPEIRQGQRTGMGVGYRASLYLLEVAQANTTGELTRRQAELACNGWGPGTIRDGLKRLTDDGLVERPERGLYRLTDAGRNAPSAPPGMLPLREPKEEEPAGALAGR